ncbi:radical SAM protein [Streptomyces rhizosphaerihabitans]|uniref:radical SAM protein n=1 Tax=Streptomyces rhizosphaerihabitans TaxID=1266770 RepID=UPI0021C12C89|nr:radical SAM protein [Streptomyces rhizosphaerihabitans]MCT9007120.1 radical SAM protein [Streptomyces rhizosphaerihabitans]
MTDTAAIPGVLDEEILTAFSDEILHLIVLPTEQCNFRCVYCYEDFSVGTMKAPVVTGVKRLLERRIPTLRQLHIGWFGGEPLIAQKVIEDISESVLMLTRTAPGITYTSEVTTNAYKLDLATAKRLHKLNIRHYQITLDGPEKFHDRTRIRRDGGGSFQKIWTNLLDLRSSSLDISVTLRVHVTPANLDVMPEFLLGIRKEFLKDSRFVILPKAVGHWGGPNDSEFNVLGHAEATQAVSALEELIRGQAGSEKVYRPGNVCYASRPNSLLIRASGDVGKCTVALSDPANSIGRLLEDGTLELREESLGPWLRGWSKDSSKALGCPLVGLPRSAGEPVLMQIGVRPPGSTKSGDVEVGK